ncbi:hypothetical protein KSS87_009445 [Heliosperma pusillum]|nr:hypothetical protein KSS87_017148 [Heliosperma pusillum]KAH9609880.1 hypothetical protein KSS87_009445 [Heliosperma pusillum]
MTSHSARTFTGTPLLISNNIISFTNFANDLEFILHIWNHDFLEVRPYVVSTSIHFNTLVD